MLFLLLQVVIAMRDLFQVVFELKKKEIELAKQQLEGKTILSARYLSTAALDMAKVYLLSIVDFFVNYARKVHRIGYNTY